MKIKLFLSTLFVCFTVLAFAQTNNDDVLFTVDDEPVMASEFVRVYSKNLDLVKDETQKDIDAYLKLFVSYQLKVKEAKRLGLDKDAKYIREFGNYKKQLTTNFLADNKVTDALVKEAYDRVSNDVKASHVLIRIDESEKDTTAVYNRLLKLRNQIAKEGFDKVKSAVHNGSTVFAEDLGYFSGFKMVYSFENVAYNTKVGEISMPFRTRFGYHIVKVFDKRPSLGQVNVAHIMVSNKQKDSLLNPETRINEIYKKIQQGEKFESLAKQFSDDNSSASKGGVLAPFTGGQLSSQEFENVAFSLNEKGEISKPFKTNYGWHIVKLLGKKGVEPFENMKGELENKVKRDSRSKLINSALTKKLKAQYNVSNNETAINYFKTLIDDSFFKKSWVIPENLNKEEVALAIDKASLSYGDFAKYLMNSQRNYFNKKTAPEVVIEKEYQTYLEKELLKYHEANLEFVNPDFAHVLKEYRDGLLLFDLMEKEVWNAATKDSVGLEAFYEKNKSNYVWQDRVDAKVFSSSKKEVVSEAIKLLEKGKTAEEIATVLNANGAQNIIVTSDVMEKGHRALPIAFEFKKGVSKIYNYNDAYHVIDVSKVMPQGIKTFDEARGKVISDYQNSIETNWLDTLGKRYNVKINDAVLAKVKTQIAN
ncbi:peptidylprolyl isomerase [Ichthyenterobacterium magnum]|uniref:Peptidyl-prolyl cis-trans isomerase SurA n=1 Tax=Ichthyenterobacterium magnum TaxID=1230530 RepID=A0A420DGG4_9FLAO|nr:peptidylprolyl isomerase [Ichthyenterobacterium magnum]RKE92178.1 peptidyl-prolyl cis-trans isomerase SurA [Ichthyenterobacterium magnum]